MKRSICWLSVVLSSCWVGSEQLAEKVNETPEVDDPIDLVVESISPSFGTNAGGYEVVITGGPFDSFDKPVVTFGGNSAEVVSFDETSITVVVPAVGVSGDVNVAVAARGKFTIASQGFHYWEDGKGKTGLFGVFETFDLVNEGVDWAFPEFEDVEGDEAHAALAVFIEPIERTFWQDYAISVDPERAFEVPNRCQVGYRFDGPRYSVQGTGVSSLSLTDTEGTVLSLPGDEDGEVFGFTAASGAELRPVTYDFQRPKGRPGWEALEIPEAVRMPDAGFVVAEPNLDQTFPEVDESFNLEWEGGSPGDVILVSIQRYVPGTNPDGGVWLPRERMTCVLQDDGRHTIGGSTDESWAPGYPNDSLVTIQVGRAHITQVEMAENRSNTDIYGIRWVLGRAYMVR